VAKIGGILARNRTGHLPEYKAEELLPLYSNLLGPSSFIEISII
jgi:hypothetical protein